MKKFLLILTIVSGMAFGQTENTTKPTVTVGGSAKAMVVPDMADLHIYLSSIKMNMGDATRAIGEQTQQYIKILRQLGFQDTDIKTTNFSASKNRIYRNNGPIDSGYVVTQHLNVKFAYNQATLQKIVARFSEAKDPVNFYIGFFLSDTLRDKTEADLQSKAVLDARRKATNLTGAAAVKMGGVRSIVYGVENNTPYYALEMRKFDNADSSDGGGLSFAPQEIELRETVTVVWFIE